MEAAAPVLLVQYGRSRNRLEGIFACGSTSSLADKLAIQVGLTCVQC